MQYLSMSNPKTQKIVAAPSWAPLNRALWYVASPYSREPDKDLAARLVAQAVAILFDHNVPTFAPIVYGHAFHQYVGADPNNFRHWEIQNHTLMHRCQGMIELRILNWAESAGMADERHWFENRGLPVIPMHLPDFPLGLLPYLQRNP
jgi:hypothetical protein